VGKIYDEITDHLRHFVEAQHMFFVATAPLSAQGHINCSPKGLDSLRILGPKTLAYLDYAGSGVETIAQVRENGRIVVMFCAFEGPPNIVRFYGQGTVRQAGSPEFASLASAFPAGGAVRSIIEIDVQRITDSCGFGVPLMEYSADRTQLHAWAERKGPDGIADYVRDKNSVSIDGLPGIG